jgi:hypothetical protein
MFIPTADAAGSIHLAAGNPPGIYYMLSPEHGAGYYRSLAELWATAAMTQLSDNKPETLIRSPSAIGAHWLSTHSKFYPDELLDWDAVIKVAPSRPSGMLTVSLEYGGRGTPTPVRDPWE